MILAVPLGVAAGLAAALVLGQLLLGDEVDLLRSLSRLTGALGASDSGTAGLRAGAVAVGALAAAALVGRLA